MRYVIATQKNSWIHLSITLLAICVGVLLRITFIEWTIIIFCIALVWIAEFFNTALEVLTDLVSPAEHPLAKISKDVGAAAVLIAAASAVMIGMLILGLPLIREILHLIK